MKQHSTSQYIGDYWVNIPTDEVLELTKWQIEYEAKKLRPKGDSEPGAAYLSAFIAVILMIVGFAIHWTLCAAVVAGMIGVIARIVMSENADDRRKEAFQRLLDERIVVNTLKDDRSQRLMHRVGMMTYPHLLAKGSQDFLVGEALTVYLLKDGIPADHELQTLAGYLLDVHEA